MTGKEKAREIAKGKGYDKPPDPGGKSQQKHNGKSEGDILRRVVSRSIAQHFASPIHLACSPHQFALSTRAGTEASVHGITVATQTDPHLTVLSVDGIGAYDTVSRNSMLRGLHAVPDALAIRSAFLHRSFPIRVA